MKHRDAMMAIALVLEGRPCTEAAEACGMDRQTLRDWVHHYNEDGIEGLSNRRSWGRPAQLTAEQLAAFKALVEQRRLASTIRAPDHPIEHNALDPAAIFAGTQSS